MHATAPGGVFLHIGLMDNNGGIDARKMTLSEIVVIGAYTYTHTDRWPRINLRAAPTVVLNRF